MNTSMLTLFSVPLDPPSTGERAAGTRKATWDRGTAEGMLTSVKESLPSAVITLIISVSTVRSLSLSRDDRPASADLHCQANCAWLHYVCIVANFGCTCSDLCIARPGCPGKHTNAIIYAIKVFKKQDFGSLRRWSEVWSALISFFWLITFWLAYQKNQLQ